MILFCRRTLPSEEDTRVQWNVVGETVGLVSGECSDSRTCVSHNNTLSIAFVHPEDRGLYSCSASNSQGNTTREVHLEVKVGLLKHINLTRIAWSFESHLRLDNGANKVLIPVSLLQVLNIILFPVSIAANFVTLSWNTSQSLARDYILQVGPRLSSQSMGNFLSFVHTIESLLNKQLFKINCVFSAGSGVPGNSEDQ